MDVSEAGVHVDQPPLTSLLFQISRHLGKMYSEMIFVNGFVHCDPHPGNVLVRKQPDTGKAEIVLLDHGLYQVGEAFPAQPAPGPGPAWLGAHWSPLWATEMGGRWPRGLERPCPGSRAVILCMSQ